MYIDNIIPPFLIEAIDQAKSKKAEYIIKQFENRWNGIPGFTSLDEFVDAVANLDPTRNGAMMPWIARLAFKNPTVNKTEDFNRLATDLKDFERVKNKLANKDINSYKTYQDVFLAIEPFLVKSPAEIKAEKKILRDNKKLAKLKDEIITVVNNANGWIRIPTTKAAAQFIGQGTRWCTSGKTRNEFNNYNSKGRLFIIYDKRTKERFQLQIETSNFADAADTMHKLSTVPNWAREPIANYYKQNNIDMSFNQLMALSNIADVTDVVNDEHEHHAMFKLMQQYT